jgi:rhamnose utilization protein RhaD (predicted bifunctional aldolase and dehydrogenase)/NAD(P)-dependent dehydrogenase (short-subunit alcohol dehydrogenase family)
MRSRYDDTDAARYAREAGHGVDEVVALRTYTARLLGSDPALVLHGGGNTSVKTRARTLLGDAIDVLCVKGSGWDLATIAPAGHPAVRLTPLHDARRLASMTDEDMVNLLRTNLLDASAPTPSVETLLHAYLPARFIDHTHADALLALADQPDGENICRRVYGAGLVWVPYVMPGFALAKRCADAFDAHVLSGREAEVIVLERHGIFTMGETAKESYERMIFAVDRAERHIEGARRTSARITPATLSLPAREAQLLPVLRGILAKLVGAPSERGPVIGVRTSDEILAFLTRPDAEKLSSIGCATPDHVLRTKPTALFLRDLPFGDDPESAGRMTHQIEQATIEYARRYDAYFYEMCAAKSVTKTKLDPWPRVILVPGVGVCAVGKTLVESRIALDVYEHTIQVMTDAAVVGAYAPVGPSDLFDVEYWSLEQAKLKKGVDPLLGGAVAVVTGAASGIGLATATRLLALGAHVLLVDRRADALRDAEATLGRWAGASVASYVADLTQPEEARAAVSATCRAFGGVDVVVSNAGDAPEGDLATEEGEARLRTSLETNLLTHNHVARAAVDVMKAQGRGGCLLFNASKAAWNPGPRFGPYAVAKAALVALMRQYAIDGAKWHLRANAVNADRVRTALFADGVAESRAAARGIPVDAYFRSNLLEREVTAEDVADAFVYLAGARATTGCVVTVDGGNPAAFPR